MEETIAITLKEYKELLIIKGKYEELKQISMPHIYPTTITYSGKEDNKLKPPYTVTCATYTSNKEG